MRLVMGGESLEGQLTGIGQYTYNLAKELAKRPEIEDLQFLVHGRLRGAENLISEHGGRSSMDVAATNKVALISGFLGRARSIAAQSNTAVTMYRHVLPVIERHALKGYGINDVYHSPNYMLPAFPGRRVVSILDLSTFRYPEQHPSARVRFVNRHIRQSLKHADRIITISNLVKQEIVERFGFPENRIAVTYLAADHSFQPILPEQFNAVAPILGMSFKSYFLFVSTLEPRKNLNGLLDAYDIYRMEQGSNALPLFIAGKVGWKSRHLYSRISSHQGSDGINYLGYVDPVALRKIVAGARALIYPSTYEGFGLPVLEAMQSGTAVITSKNTAMAEIGRDSVIQIDPYCAIALANAIGTVSQSTGITKALEIRGLHLSKEFSWKRCAEETVQAYYSD